MTSSATNYYYTRNYFYLDTTPLLVVLCLTLWTGFDVVEGRVADRNCQSGFYYDPFAAVCQRCSACPPGQEPRERCSGYTTSQTECSTCPMGTYSGEWSKEGCKRKKKCVHLGFPTLSIGNTTHDAVCDTKCLPGFVKPGGVDSLCIQCKKDSPIAQCAEWLKEQKTNEGGGLEGANISNSSSGDADGSRGDLDETGVELPEAGGMDKKSLGLIAGVVTSSVVISAVFVGLILCCVCRRNRGHHRSPGRGEGGSSSSRRQSSIKHQQTTNVVGVGGSSGAFCFGRSKRHSYSGGQRADQNSMSDYEMNPHCSCCCLSLRWKPFKRTEDSSNTDYCIKDNSFVFKNGKSLELSDFNQYPIGSEKLSPNCDIYGSIHGCSRKTASNKSNTSQPSTLKSLQNQKISQLNPIEDFIPGAHEYAPQSNSTLKNPQSMETSMDGAEFAASRDTGPRTVAGTIQPDLEQAYLPATGNARLSRQGSEKRREQERIERAQECVYKLRHVSPVRLRSASETIFGTNSGKEAILDLLQTKEPEEVLALKIELISQIYENLRLSDLSADIVKEMTTEMEKLSQLVSLNLGRAFIDTFDLKIKAKSVTCAQLLAKTFKHRGQHISVPQFLNFLHQFGDRLVAEANCDLLIRWYRHETSRHRMSGNQMLQGQHASLVAGFSQAHHPTSLPLSGHYSMQPGYGTPGVSKNRHQMIAPMARHSLAVPTNVQIQPFTAQQQNQSITSGIPNSHLMTANEGDRKYNSMQNPHSLHQSQNAQVNNFQLNYNYPLNVLPNNTAVAAHYNTGVSNEVQGANFAHPGFRGQNGSMQQQINAQQVVPRRQPQQRFMPQEEVNSECGEDDVFA